jgi:hypothetical protein
MSKELVIKKSNADAIHSPSSDERTTGALHHNDFASRKVTGRMVSKATHLFEVKKKEG